VANASTPATPTGWLTSIEGVVKATIVSQIPGLLQAELAKLGAPGVPSIPTGPSLTKLDAWERAGRTLLMGLLITLLGAVVQVIGELATNGTTVDFFTKSGWVAVGTLFVGAVFTSLASYAYRFLKLPAQTVPPTTP
jgi:hypothetical protein